jgi:hypothetical protein
LLVCSWRAKIASSDAPASGLFGILGITLALLAKNAEGSSCREGQRVCRLPQTESKRERGVTMEANNNPEYDELVSALKRLDVHRTAQASLLGQHCKVIDDTRTIVAALERRYDRLLGRIVLIEHRLNDASPKDSRSESEA